LAFGGGDNPFYLLFGVATRIFVNFDFGWIRNTFKRMAKNGLQSLNDASDCVRSKVLQCSRRIYAIVLFESHASPTLLRCFSAYFRRAFSACCLVLKRLRQRRELAIDVLEEEPLLNDFGHGVL
jgi:hypothetical protein